MKSISSLESAVQQVSENLSPEARASYFFNFILDINARAEQGNISDKGKESIFQKEALNLMNMDRKSANKFSGELMIQSTYHMLYQYLQERLLHLHALIGTIDTTIGFIDLIKNHSPEVAAAYKEDKFSEYLRLKEHYVKEKNDILASDIWQDLEVRGYLKPDIRWNDVSDNGI